MLPQDKPTAAEIKEKKAQEMSVKLSTDTIAALKVSGYYVKKVDDMYTAHLVKCPYPLNAPSVTQNGAWRICHTDFLYRGRQRAIAAAEPVVVMIEQL